MIARSHHRISSLEAARGLAAIVVVVWHTFFAFAPELTGTLQGDVGFSGSPFFVLMNGPGAVTLFFVLSGFVLTRHAVIKSDNHAVILGILKRYPRLMLPVLISVLVSYILFDTGLYRFSEAAEISQSTWLARFGYAYETPFVPTLMGAVAQGVFTCFFLGETFYNSSLWTMKIELVGSFLAFGVAFCCINIRKNYKRSNILELYLIVIILLLCWEASSYVLAFGAGVALSILLPERSPLLSNGIFAFPTALLGLYLIGFSKAVGAFWFFDPKYVVEVNILGAIILISVLLFIPMKGMGEALAISLGRLSFPLYLIHIFVIFTASSSIFITLQELNKGLVLFLVTLFTVIFSIIIALPLAYANDRWVALVNSVTHTLLHKKD